MATLKDRITFDMKEAMRARDAVRLEAIRLLRAEVQRKEVDEKIQLEDANVLTIVQKMIKQGKDSIEQFKKGNREDLVQKELSMISVLENYLPVQLNEDELINIVEKSIKENKFDSIKDMGKAIAIIKPLIQGQAEMSVVSALVKARLNT